MDKFEQIIKIFESITEHYDELIDQNDNKNQKMNMIKNHMLYMIERFISYQESKDFGQLNQKKSTLEENQLYSKNLKQKIDNHNQSNNQDIKNKKYSHEKDDRKDSTKSSSQDILKDSLSNQHSNATNNEVVNYISNNNHINQDTKNNNSIQIDKNPTLKEKIDSSNKVSDLQKEKSLLNNNKNNQLENFGFLKRLISDGNSIDSSFKNKKNKPKNDETASNLNTNYKKFVNNLRESSDDRSLKINTNQNSKSFAYSPESKNDNYLKNNKSQSPESKNDNYLKNNKSQSPESKNDNYLKNNKSQSPESKNDNYLKNNKSQSPESKNDNYLKPESKNDNFLKNNKSLFEKYQNSNDVIHEITKNCNQSQQKSDIKSISKKGSSANINNLNQTHNELTNCVSNNQKNKKINKNKLNNSVEDMIVFIKTNLLKNKDINKAQELQENIQNLENSMIKQGKFTNLSPHKYKNGLHKENQQPKPSPAKRLLKNSSEVNVSSVFDKVEPTLLNDQIKLCIANYIKKSDLQTEDRKELKSTEPEQARNTECNINHLNNKTLKKGVINQNEDEINNEFWNSNAIDQRRQSNKMKCNNKEDSSYPIVEIKKNKNDSINEKSINDQKSVQKSVNQNSNLSKKVSLQNQNSLKDIFNKKKLNDDEIIKEQSEFAELTPHISTKKITERTELIDQTSSKRKIGENCARKMMNRKTSSYQLKVEENKKELEEKIKKKTERNSDWSAVDSKFINKNFQYM